MPVIDRSALVPYTDEQMFLLVDRIDAYPEFLPWCAGSAVHARSEKKVEASIDIATMGIKKTFTTANALTPYSHIQLNLVDGPFERLEGHWRFQSLGEEGSKVSLVLDFEYKGGWAYAAFGTFFSHVANQLVDAFCERAKVVYGDKA